MSAIEIKNLTKKFEIDGDTVTALKDVSLSVEKGDIFGIIGMSGAFRKGASETSQQHRYDLPEL